LKEENRDHDTQDDISNEMRDEMEAALRRLGTGGQVEEVHLEEVLDPETGAVRQVKRKRTTKTLKPDYRALMFWLTNRLPKRWSGKIQPSPPAEAAEDNQWYDEDWMG
jgi:hypothetical protein